MTPKVKTNIVPTAIGSWGVAATARVAYDLLKREAVGFFATVPATLRLSNVVRINANLGWAFDRRSMPLSDLRAPSTGTARQCLRTLTAEVFGLAGKATGARG